MDIVKVRQEIAMGKTIYDLNLRVADYGRVSTDKDDQLNSLENQINYFNDMIDSVSNWTHVASYTDEGISGTQVYKRDNFLKMIEDSRLGKIDLIVTKEVSRFARNTIDSIKYTQLLLQYGVIVYFISDNINTIYPDSEFRLTLMASMAQDEVRKLSERVKFGIRRSIKDGKLGGSGLTGYFKKDGRYIINEKEAPIVRKLFSLYATGEYGFARIGEKLAEDGYYTKKGKIFCDVTLKKMLKNPRYKGYYTANLSEVEDYKTHKKRYKPKEEWVIYKDEKGMIPALVSEELWEKANRVYEERNNRWNKNVLNKEFYLQNRNYTSKIFCKEHNTTFIRSATGKRSLNPVWQCNEYLRHGIKSCQTPILYEKHLNEIFSDVISDFVSNKDILLNEILEDYQTIIKEIDYKFDIDNLKYKLSEQEVFKERLLDMLLRKMISDEEYILKNIKITTEIEELKNKILKLKTQKENGNYYISIIKQFKRYLVPNMNIKSNIGKYFNLFIDKVFVSKINNDRKHIKLEIIFNFKTPDRNLEIDFNTYKEGDSNSASRTLRNRIDTTTNHKYLTKLSYDNDFFKQKYLLLKPEEPRLCKIRTNVR